MGVYRLFLSKCNMPTKTLTYGDMALEAVLNIKAYNKGASRQAIKKYIEVNHKKIGNLSALRTALAKAVASGDLIQEGQRFRLKKEKRLELRKPAPVKKKKPKQKKKPAKKKTKKKKPAKKKTKKKKPAKKTTKKKKPTKKTKK